MTGNFFLELSPNFSVRVIRKVCPLANSLDVLFSYSLIKRNDVIPSYKIWISVGINDVNYDVLDRNKDIHSCLQADEYIITCM